MFTRFRALCLVVVVFLTPLSVPSVSAQVPGHSITALRVLQPGPLEVREGYEFGSVVQAQVTYEVQPGVTVGSQVYFKVELGETNPVVLGSRYAGAGGTGDLQSCRWSATSSTQWVDQDVDLLLLDSDWAQTAAPAGAVVVPDGKGAPAGIPIASNPHPPDGTAQVYSNTVAFAFAVICDDYIVEPRSEQLRISVWIAPSAATGRLSPSGALESRDLVLLDDDVRPQAPRSVDAVGVVGDRITVTWDPPSNAGTADIRKYVVDLDPDAHGAWPRATGSDRSSITHRDSRIANPDGGISAKVCASLSPASDLAEVQRRCGPWSVPVTVDFSSAVDIPSGFTVTPGSDDGTVDVRWTAVDGAAGYEIAYRQRGRAWPSTPETVRVTDASHPLTRLFRGLVNGVLYEFRMRAFKFKGAGTTDDPYLFSLWTEPEEVTVPGTLVQAPTRPGVPDPEWSGSDAHFVVTWDPPGNLNTGGYTVAGYDVQYFEVGGTARIYEHRGQGGQFTSAIFGTGGTTPPNDIRLGCPYRFRVRAVTTQNVDGAWSGQSAIARAGSQTCGAGLQPPGVFAAAAGSAAGTVDLSWSVPTSGASPARYRIERADGTPAASPGGEPWTGVSLPVGSLTTVSVTGLREGQQYSFAIRSELAAATRTTPQGATASAWQQATGTPGETEPVDRPPPVDLELTGELRSIRAVWKAPEADSGPVDYEVSWRPLGAVAPTSRYTSATSFVVGVESPPLVAGTEYVVGVRAWYVKDGRDPSNASIWVTGNATALDRRPLAAPTALSVTPRPSALHVTWTPPTATPGPTGYEVCRALGQGTWTDCRAMEEPAFTYTGLTPDVEYRIRVRARYAAGDSAWVFGRGTPTRPGLPAAPEAVTVTPSETSILVSWTAPTADGAPSGYEVRWAEDEGSFGTVRATNFTSFNIADLKPSTRYRVQVRALYSGGRGGSGWVDAGARTLDPAANGPPVVRQVPAAVEITVDGTADVDVSSTFTDPENDALTYAARSDRPDVVTVSLGTGPRYTLTAVSVGQAVVTITADDGQPGRVPVPASFGVTVVPGPVNQPPRVATPLPAVTVTLGRTVAVNIAAAFTDPEGDPLSATASSDRPDVAALSTSGTVIRVTGVSIGVATVTVGVTDRMPGPGRPVMQTFQVTVDEVENSPPALVGAVPAVVRVEVGRTEVVTLVFTDPDGDRLAYTAASSRPGIATARAASSSTGVDVSIAGVSIGEAQVTVQASDGRLSTPAAVAVEVVLPVADAPAAPLDVVARAAERSIDVVWTPGAPPGDRFRVRWREIIVLPDKTTSTAGDWVDAGPRTGTSFTLRNLKQATTYRIEVRSELSASSAGADCAPLCSEWVGAEATTGRGNRAPVAEGDIPAVSLLVYGVAARNVSSFFSDPDGDPLTYSAVVTDMTVVRVEVSGAQVGLVGLRGGATDVAVTARDPGGLAAVQRFAVEVVPPPPPVIKLALPEGAVFEPGGVLPFRVEAHPPAVAAIEVHFDAGGQFVLSGAAGGPARRLRVVVPPGSPGVDVELREKQPYFRLGELIPATVRALSVGPPESGAVLDGDDWPFTVFRSNALPYSTVEFAHDGNGMAHAALGEWARIRILVDPPLPLEAGDLAAGSRVRITHVTRPAPPRVECAEFRGRRLPGGRPFDPAGWLPIPPGTPEVEFQIRLGHVDDVPRGCPPVTSAMLYIEERVEGRLLDLGAAAELYVSPDGGVVVPSIGAWGVVVLGLLLGYIGVRRVRAASGGAVGGRP